LSDKFGGSSGDDPSADEAITQTLFSEDFESYGALDPARNPLGPWTYSGPGGPPKDFKGDTDDQGELITKTRDVVEPFVNVNAKGIAKEFPLVSQAVAAAKRVNWNGNNTFDEAVFNKREGVYRTKVEGDRTIIYFDSNRNGNSIFPIDISTRLPNLGRA
jgi:hypothetical protein